LNGHVVMRDILLGESKSICNDLSNVRVLEIYD